MPDIIRLLPDHIANQIAAGEVIQRPASVVKELLENAIDAGATKIKVIVKDAGKSLIQVIDNGSGMTSTDARMSLERHATSKIASAEDLFTIQTKGFRGEALASIASVAQMEIKTKMDSDELGTRLIVNGSKVEVQEPVACLTGTDIAIKKLFFNIPARRKFLKSDTAEFKHIFSEFNRVVLAHPGVQFELHHNDKLMHQLPSETGMKRVIGVLGKFSKDKLILIEEETEIVNIKGYIGTAESARSRRDDQYLYINDRFFKSNYFNHAIAAAYGNLIQEGKYPAFVMFLTVDPSKIDVNVHPTKQEIKFEDDRAIYNYLKVAVRHGLARHHMIPVMDFEPTPAFLRSTPDLRSKSGSPSNISFSTTARPQQGQAGWETIFEGIQQKDEPQADSPNQSRLPDHIYPAAGSDTGTTNFRGYLLRSSPAGVMLIHQRAAHTRILYEEFLKRSKMEKAPTQGLIFPSTLELNPKEAAMMDALYQQLNQLGFDLAPFGQNTYVLHGVPNFQAGIDFNEQTVLSILHEFMDETSTPDTLIEKLAETVAKKSAITMDKVLSDRESRHLVEQLFDCDLPDRTPSGQKCYIILSKEEIDLKFKN